MPFDNHRFCWFGINSTDVERVIPFYTNVIGWTVEKVQMGDSVERMFVDANGQQRGHFTTPAAPGIPSHWHAYMRVEDVDASARAAVEHGGSIVVPAMDIPPGRFSAVKSPSGAVFSLFKEANPDSKSASDCAGAIVWTEMHSTDVAPDLAWAKAVFGYTIGEMPMPDGVYNLLNDDAGSAGGVMPAMMPGMPSMWMSWVGVPDVDAALVRVTENGGQVFGEAMDMPGVGRMCAVADNTGGVFGLMTPSDRS